MISQIIMLDEVQPFILILGSAPVPANLLNKYE